MIGIPKGTRARAGDLFFATTLYAEIPVGEETVDVPAVCLSTGTAGNGYLSGEINVLVDPVNYVDRIENLTETAGGTDRNVVDAGCGSSLRILLRLASWSRYSPVLYFKSPIFPLWSTY